MTPTEHKKLRPVNPTALQFLAKIHQDSPHQYIKELLQQPKQPSQDNQNWFPIPDNPGDITKHTPTQTRVLNEFDELQRLEKLDPTIDEQQRAEFLQNFDWIDSTLTKTEQQQVEDILV